MYKVKKAFVAGYKAIPPNKPLIMDFREKVTVLVGPNASGKSAFLEALYYTFKQAELPLNVSFKRLKYPIVVGIRVSDGKEEKDVITFFEPHKGKYVPQHVMIASDRVLENVAEKITKLIFLGSEKVIEILDRMAKFVYSDSEDPVWVESKAVFFDANLSRRSSLINEMLSEWGISSESVKKIEEWIRNFGYTRFRVFLRAEGSKIEFYDGKVGEWVDFEEVPGGLKFTLPLVFSLSSPCTHLFIDDLEVGLHPAMQIKIVDEIIKSGKQAVITTHSETVFYYALYKSRTDDIRVNLLYRDEEGVYAEKVTENVELSEKAKEALKEFGSIGLFGESAFYSLKLVAEARE